MLAITGPNADDNENNGGSAVVPLWKGGALVESARKASRKPAFLGDEDAYKPANDGKGPIIIDGEATVISVDEIEKPEAVSKKGFLKNLFSKFTMENIKERGKDIAAGAAITSAARFGSMFVMGGVGLTGLPLIVTGAVAAGVARTVWNIQKERKAHILETGNNVSFWEWATKKDEDNKIDNKKKYLLSLGTSTAFATLGSTFMTWALPHIETVVAPWIAERAAPLVETVKNSAVFASVAGAVAPVWNNFFGSTTPAPVQPPVKVDATSIEEMRRTLGLSTQTPAPTNMTPMDPSAIQRRIEEAHGAVTTPASPTQMSPDTINQRVAEAHALATGAKPPETAEQALQERFDAAFQQPAQPSLVDAPPPALPSAQERITAAMENSRLSRRWTAIAERALEGNAQAQKDIAQAMLNGTNGFAKNPEVAVEIYRAASAAGNMQATVDLAFLQFHGKAGIQANPQEALATLREHAGSNKYARSTLDKLSNIGTPSARTASAAMQRAVENVTASTQEVPVRVAGVTPTAESPLNVSWTQNASGEIVGNIQNPPSWLQDGTVVTVPIAQVR